MRRRLSYVLAVGLASWCLSTAVTPAQAKPACEDSATSETAALAVAKACRSKVEIAGLRTEYQKIFAHPNGSQSFEISAVPQRVKKDGLWHDIDTKLQRGKDGRLSPKAGADVSFSNGGGGPFVVTTIEGKRFELSWPDPLPAPKVDGDTATYPDVLEGVDLTVRATREGYAHTLVVKTAAAAGNPALAQVRYRVSGDLTLVSEADGSLTLTDAKGNKLPWGSHASAMWDSSTDPALGGEVLAGAKPSAPSTAAEPGPGARVRSVGVRVSDSSLIVTPDAELMRTGKLPLYIDPPLDRNKMGWAYATNTNSNWTPGEHARVGRNPDDGRLFRSFFEFPMSGIQGVQITYAAVGINLDHSSACAGNTAYLYRSDSVGGANGTRVAWSTGLQTGPLASAWGQSNEAGGCSGDQGDDWLVFPHLTGDVGYGSGQGWPTYTIGLCMCSNSSGSGESGTYQWMKFHHSTAVLAGTFNRPPGTPADLKTSGAACGATVATTSPQLRAQYADPDNEGNLSATFEWRELPSGGVNSVAGPAKPANNYGDVTLNLGAASEGKSYSWRVITSDGISSTQGVSGWCDFTVNASPAPTPTVTSTEFPNDGVAHLSPGMVGKFTFSVPAPAGQDVTTYVYGWTDPPTKTITVTAGAPASVWLYPQRHGYNTLHVYTKEASGIASPTTHYQFLTGSPEAPTHHWPLDDMPGHGMNDVIRPNHLSGTGATLTPNVRHIGSSGYVFANGADLSTTQVLETDRSFSVSAWVRMTDGPAGYTAIASQEGVNTSNFILYATPDRTEWAFALYDTDSTSTAGTFVHTPAQKNVWTHLTAVYDAGEKEARLYVNGELRGTKVRSTPVWYSSGRFHVGWAKFGAGSTMTPGIGSIADVRVWRRVVMPEDMWGTNADPVAGTQSTTGMLSPTEVGTWNFDSYDTIDGSYWSRHMTLNGSAGFSDVGHDQGGAFLNNGTAGSASTAGPVLHTSESFTVSAWVRLNSNATDQLIIGGADGVSSVPFFLSYDVDTLKWAFTVVDANTATPNWTPVWSSAPAAVSTWTHLTGVYDAAKGEIRLYVNGVKVGTRTGVKAWESSDGLFVGGRSNGNYPFNGEIDQVKAFMGAMSDREAANLYTNSL